MPVAIVIGLLVLYLKTIGYSFVNWDDEAYIVHNPLIKKLSWEGVKSMFLTTHVNATYSPVVLLSWAVDYAVAKTDPSQYHLTNVLLHLCNTLLVFLLIKKITNRFLQGVAVMAMFAFHPYQVEVVAWVSARKDLLMTFFYLLGLLSYLQYSTNRKKTWYFIVFLFFALAVFSKGVAVTFPIVLILIDYWQKRLSWKSLIIKVPFFIGAIIVGVLAIQGQNDTGAFHNLNDLNILQKASFASYNYLTFIINSFLPIKLSGFHPVPHALTQSFPKLYYLSFIVFIVLLVLVFVKFHKNRFIILGVGFFIITIFPVIQFFPIGLAQFSERYSYLPFIGLFLVSSYLFMYMFSQKKIWAILPVFMIAVFYIVTFSRIPVWENGKTLWADVKNNYPTHEIGYINSADFFRKSENRTKAITEYILAIQKVEKPYKSHNQLGFIFTDQGKFKKAIHHLNQSVKIKSNYASTFLNRGICFMKMGNLKKAKKDFAKVIQLDTSLKGVYYNLAIIFNHEGQYKKSNEFLNHFMTFNSMPKGYALLAENNINLNKNKEALINCQTCLTLNSREKKCLYLKGVVLMQQKQYNESISVYDTLINFYPNHKEAILNRGVCFLNTAKHHKALLDFETVIQLDSNYRLAYDNRDITLKKIKDKKYK